MKNEIKQKRPDIYKLQRDTLIDEQLELKIQLEELLRENARLYRENTVLIKENTELIKRLTPKLNK